MDDFDSRTFGRLINGCDSTGGTSRVPQPLDRPSNVIVDVAGLVYTLKYRDPTSKWPVEFEDFARFLSSNNFIPTFFIDNMRINMFKNETFMERRLAKKGYVFTLSYAWIRLHCGTLRG